MKDRNECKYSQYIADGEGFIDGWYCELNKDWCKYFPEEQHSCKDYIDGGEPCI